MSARDGASDWELGYMAGEAGGKRRGFQAGYMAGTGLGVAVTALLVWLGGCL